MHRVNGASGPRFFSPVFVIGAWLFACLLVVHATALALGGRIEGHVAGVVFGGALLAVNALFHFGARRIMRGPVDASKVNAPSLFARRGPFIVVIGSAFVFALVVNELGLAVLALLALSTLTLPVIAAFSIGSWRGGAGALAAWTSLTSVFVISHVVDFSLLDGGSFAFVVVTIDLVVVVAFTLAVGIWPRAKEATP